MGTQLEDDLGISLGDDPAPVAAPVVAAPAIAPTQTSPVETRERWLIIDTEGSGLFKHRDENGVTIPSDAPGQPRMASMALIFVDADLNIEREYQAYIRPDGWEVDIESEAFKKHGLTTEFLRANGIAAVEALAVFEQGIREGRAVVAFNAQHDLRHIRAELRHAGRDDLFGITRNSCAMRGLSGRGVKKANGKGGFPQLADACAHFGFAQEAAHTALGDARDCFRVFCEMHKRGWLPEPQIHLAKNKE